MAKGAFVLASSSLEGDLERTVRLSYNISFSAYFFSRNNIFLSQQINRNNISACFFSEANGAIIFYLQLLVVLELTRCNSAASHEERRQSWVENKSLKNKIHFDSL